MTLTVYPLPKVADVSTTGTGTGINGSDAATVSTTCEGVQTSPITTSIGHTLEPVMSQSGDTTMRLNSLTLAAPSASSSPGLLGGTATAGHITTDAEEASPLFSTLYDAPDTIDNTPATQPMQEFDATSTSTIQITSTITVVVATVTAVLSETVSPENTVQRATDGPRPVTSPIELVDVPPNASSVEKPPPKEITNITFDAPEAFIEVYSTVTRVVAAYPSSCETIAWPTDASETQTSTTDEAGSTFSSSDASSEVVATGAIPGASTAAAVGPVPTIHSYRPLQQNLNTLLTQSSVSGDSPTLSGVIGSATVTGAASRVHMGYASLVIGFFVFVVLLLAL